MRIRHNQPEISSLICGTLHLRNERTRQTFGPLIWQNTPGARGIGEWFSEQGYATVSLGKIWHTPDGENGDEFQTSWRPDEPDFQLPEHQQHIDPDKRWIFKRGVLPLGEAADLPDDAYPDGQIALKAIEQLRSFHASGEPFLLAVGFNKPHIPLCCPKQYWDLYDREKIPLPTQRNFPDGAPEWTRNFGISGYADVPEGGDVSYSDEQTRAVRHAYAACTSFADAQIGRVLSELKTLGLEDNTLVVLWGDHGWFLGDLDQWHKSSNFERAVRAPLIIKGPNVTQGKTCSELVETVDIFPTILEYCGLKSLPLSDGTSFLPLLAEPHQPWKTAVYHIYDRHVPDLRPKTLVIGYAVRTQSARYIEWHHGWGLDTPLIEREFYRYSDAQPDEVRNQVDEPELQTEIERHAALLRCNQFGQPTAQK